MASGEARKKVVPQRVSGKVVEWKGKFGWIMPSSPIKHPEATKRNGKVYLAQEDVEQELSGVGATVSFFVYADKSGLGAMNCVPSNKQPASNSQPAKWGSAAEAQKKGGGGAKGAGKAGAAKAGGAKAGGAKAGGAKGGGAKGGGSKGGGAKNGGGAPGGRTKVFPQRISGVVSDWRGNFGWITSSQPIDHPKAKKNGKLYVGQEDVEADLAGIGAKVSFFVYSDANGIGAMNVRPGGAGKAEKRPGKGGKGGEKANGAAPQKKKQKTKEQGEKLPKEQVAPDKSARTPVTTTPVSGKVVRAKGKVAWIKPLEPIEHENAEKNGGTVYLHADDLEAGDFPLAGAEVIFFVYEDDKGLGAEHCQVTEQGDGVEEPREPREKKNGASKKAEKKSGLGGVKASKLVKSTALKSKVQTKGKGKGKKTKGRGKGKSEEKEKGPRGPDLDRERITLTPISGEVLHWNERAQFGWIKPTEAVDHPDGAGKEVKKLYFHQKDVADGTVVEKGSTVTFQVYKDACNLGAEEVS